jgi:hypothetical protein
MRSPFRSGIRCGIRSDSPALARVAEEVEVAIKKMIDEAK